MGEIPTRQHTALGRPKKKRRTPSVSYGPGHYRPAPNGRGFDCSVCLNGRRERTRVESEIEARAWIDATEAGGVASMPSLTRVQLIDAQQAFSVLPFGVTLAQVAQAWLEANTDSSPPSDLLSVCREAFLADKLETKIRPVTFALYRQGANRLIKAIGDIPVAEVTRDHISDLVSGMSAQSRNGLLRNVGAFLSWCADTGRIPSNPVASIRKAIVPEPPRGVITPRQVEAILAAAAARRPDLIPYLVLGFFAGMRPDELYRFKPSLIGEKYILLDGTVTKTSATRSIAVRPNLAAWLKAFPPVPGRKIPPLTKKHLYACIRKIKDDTLKLAQEEQDKTLAVHKWPDDCCRHCFATYEYEKTGNAAAVASEMGHKGVQVFFTHYRALSTPGDGALYAAITPEKVSNLTTVCQRLLQPVGNEQGQHLL